MLQAIFSSDWFRYGALPLIGGLLVVLVKRDSRLAPLQKEDFAIGLDLMVTAILMKLLTITDAARRIAAASLGGDPSAGSPHSGSKIGVAAIATQMHDSAFSLALMIAGLWGTTVLVRRWGWTTDGKEMSMVRGIVLPLLIGILYLYASLAGVK